MDFAAGGGYYDDWWGGGDVVLTMVGDNGGNGGNGRGATGAAIAITCTLTQTDVTYSNDQSSPDESPMSCRGAAGSSRL